MNSGQVLLVVLFLSVVTTYLLSGIASWPLFIILALLVGYGIWMEKKYPSTHVGVDSRLLQSTGKDLLASMLYWKVAIARVLLYCALSFGNTFVALTETFGDDTWSAMGWFTKGRVLLQCLLGAIPPLIAFFDSTLSVMRAQAGLPPQGQTEFMTKPR